MWWIDWRMAEIFWFIFLFHFENFILRVFSIKHQVKWVTTSDWRYSCDGNLLSIHLRMKVDQMLVSAHNHVGEVQFESFKSGGKVGFTMKLKIDQKRYYRKCSKRIHDFVEWSSAKTTSWYTFDFIRLAGGSHASFKHVGQKLWIKKRLNVIVESYRDWNFISPLSISFWSFDVISGSV